MTCSLYTKRGHSTLIVHDTTDYAGPLVAEAVGIPHATAGFTDFRPRDFFQSTGADLVNGLSIQDWT